MHWRKGAGKAFGIFRTAPVRQIKIPSDAPRAVSDERYSANDNAVDARVSDALDDRFDL
jgi:hypothetical protein